MYRLSGSLCFKTGKFCIIHGMPVNIELAALQMSVAKRESKS